MSLLHSFTAVLLSLALGAVAGCERVRQPRGSEPVIGAGDQRSTLQLSPQAAPPSPPLPSPPPSLEATPPEAKPAPAEAAPEFPNGELDSVAAPPREQGAVPRSGVRSETCVKGWRTPPRGSALRKAALDMIRARRSERFVVLEMRYFVGPEDAEVLGRRREVERWY